MEEAEEDATDDSDAPIPGGLKGSRAGSAKPAEAWSKNGDDADAPNVDRCCFPLVLGLIPAAPRLPRIDPAPLSFLDTALFPERER